MADQAERLREISRQNGEPSGEGSGKPCRVVAVSSGKGGVGKTNLVVNLALVLSQWNQQVVVIDADLGLANVDVLVNAIPKYTLVDVINGTRDIKDAILQGPYDLKFISGGSGFANMANLDIESRNRLINQLKTLENESNVILIDTGAGISRNVLSFVGAADEFVIITTPEPTALTDAYGMLKVMAKNDYRNKAGVIVNFASDVHQGKEIFNRLEGVLKRYVPNMDIHYLGSILFDPVVSKSVEECKPFVISYPKSPASVSMHNIAKRFLHQDVEDEIPKRGIQGFLERLVKFVK